MVKGPKHKSREKSTLSCRSSKLPIPITLPGREGFSIIGSFKKFNIIESLKELFCTVSGGRQEANRSGRPSKDGVSAMEYSRKPLAQMMSKMCSLALSVSDVVSVSSFSFFGLVVLHCLFTMCHMFFLEPLLTLLRAYSKRRTYSGATAGASSGSAAGGLYQRF